MNLQTILYFSSILLTCILTGFLAWYAWKHDQVPASRAYMRLTLSEYFFALAEIFSVLSPSSTTALFWFQTRYIAGAFIGVFWFVFALEYSGRKEWLSKRLLVGLFVIPFVTQVLLWSNSLHGLWIKREAGFTQNGIFWIADITSRIPGLGYLTHSFYTLILTLAGIALMFLTAWKMRREFIGQALLLAGAGLTAFTFAMNSLFNFLPKTGFNPFTPGIGLSVLLIALSVFRFEFLKRAPAQESDSRITRLDAQEKYSLAIFILIFILFTSGIAAVSYLTYQNYETQFSAQVENQLSAIASLKVDELQNWRNERLADASLFYRNKNFSWRVQRYLDNPQDPAIQAELLMWMEKLQAHPEYTRIFLINSQGIELISTLDTLETIPEDLIQQASTCLASGEITFLDFHRHSEEDIVHLSILIPIFDAQDGNRPLGVLVLLIDPNVYLYPFIQQWPVFSQSSETLLVRRDGEDVLYLNELKFGENNALNLRIPLKETQVLAVQAVLGQTGIVHGLDYRGVDVIGDLRAVPDSPWFMVTRMDTEEVYVPLRERLWQTVLFFSMLVLITGAGLMLVWRQQRVRFYRRQVEAAEALRSSEEKFRLAFDTSPDSVAITRLTDGMFVSVNKGFEQISGYTREQAIGKTSAEINIWKDPEDRRKVVEALRAKGEVRNYEAPFLTRDGEIYGMMSAVIIELNGEPHILNITRDITERKQAEVALRASEDKFRSLFENMVSACCFDKIIYKDGIAVDYRIMDVNPSYARILGISKDEVMGKLASEIYKTNDIPFFDIYARVAESGVPEVFESYFAPAGIYLQVMASRPAPGMFSTVFSDITERKLAEDALRESENKFKYIFDNSVIGKSITLPSGEINVNRAFCEMLGYSQEELKGGKWQEISHPDDLELTQTVIGSLLSGEKESARFVKRYIHKNGSTVWADVGTALRRDKDGKPLYFMTTVNDITERKQAEEALRESRAILQAAMDNSPAGIAIADAPDGKLRYVNNAGLLIRGGDRQSIVDGIGIDEYVASWQMLDLDGRPLKSDEVPLARAVLFGETNSREFIVRRTSDDDRIVLGNAAPIMDERGKVTAGIVIFTDITERKQAETSLQKSQMQLQAIMDYSPALISIKDLDGNIVLANRSFAALDAPPLNELIGKNVFDIFPREVSEQLWNNDLAALQAKAPVRSEEVVKHKDGVWHTYFTVKFPIYLQSDQPFGICAISNDITERKQAESALRETNEYLENLFNYANAPIIVWDPQFRITRFNHAFETLTGRSAAEVLGKSLEILFPPALVQDSMKLIQKTLSGERWEVVEISIQHVDGSIRTVLWNSATLFAADGKTPFATIAQGQDITERKQSNEKLIASELRYRRLFETAKDGILILDADTGMIVDVNPFLIEMLGFSHAEFQDKKIWELGFFKDIVSNQDNFLELQQNEYIRYEDMPLETADGRRINVEFISNVYQVNHQKVVQCNIRDITERRQAEEKLRYQAALLESVSDAIVASDAQFHITVWNAAAQSLYGWKTEEVLGRNGLEFTRTEWPATDAEKMRLTIAEKGRWRGEATQARKDGSRIPVEVSSLVLRDENGQITGYISANRDITERKRAEEILQEYNARLETEVEQRTHELREIQEQLVRQERLATLGQLAGSIGHELRNPLGVISNAVYFLKLSQPDASEMVKEYLDIIEKETRTSDKIVTDLLDFTRVKSLDRQPVSVSELIRQALERYPAPESVEVELDVPADLPPIYADPLHVIQVFGNLISNACQAMTASTANDLKLRVSAAAQGAMIKIEMQDTGEGIPPENMKKIFEPLFTTKIKGIGLGLAVSRKLTEANGGRIEVESEAGKGSTFTVYLPVYEE